MSNLSQDLNIEQFRQELNVELDKIINNFNLNLELRSQKLISDITNMIDNYDGQHRND